MAAVESEYVHKVYSQIAPHFSDTRYKPWPRIKQFLLEQPCGSIIADVGCGNGRYLGVNPLCTYMLGSDMCPELVTIARGRNHQVAVCDCLNLPYRSSQFDAAICIAVVHHLSTVERRTQALRELARILRRGGRLLVYVWALEQDRKKFSSQDVMVPWHLQPKYCGPKVPKPPYKHLRQRRRKKQHRPEDANLESSSLPPPPCCPTSADHEMEGDASLWSELSAIELSEQENDRATITSCSDERALLLHEPRESDAWLQTGNQGTGKYADVGTESTSLDSHNCSTSRSTLIEMGYQTFQRYYHVFCRGELSGLFRSGVPEVCVVEEFYDHENWCVLAEKL